MDMLYKDDLPFLVKIKSFWNNIEYISDEEEIEYFLTDKNKDVIKSDKKVVLTEYRNFNIEFVTEKNLDASLKIENTGRLNEENLILKPNDIKSLYKMRKDKEYPWVPDEYLLTVEINDNKYYSSFIVEPKNISSNQIKKLKDMINNLVKGIVFDIKYKKRNVLGDRNDYFLETELFLLDIVEKEFKMLLKNTRDIINNPISKLINKYEERNDKFYLDKKSVKWLASSRGQALNHSIYNPNIIYQNRNKVSINNLENKWFIKCIFFIRKYLKNLKDKLYYEIEELNNRVLKLENKVNQSIDELNQLKSIQNSYSFTQDINIKQGQIKGKNEEINNYKKDIKIIGNYSGIDFI